MLSGNRRERKGWTERTRAESLSVRELALRLARRERRDANDPRLQQVVRAAMRFLASCEKERLPLWEPNPLDYNPAEGARQNLELAEGGATILRDADELRQGGTAGIPNGFTGMARMASKPSANVARAIGVPAPLLAALPTPSLLKSADALHEAIFNRLTVSYPDTFWGETGNFLGEQVAPAALTFGLPAVSAGERTAIALEDVTAGPTGNVYSVAYEVKLAPADIAASRKVHFNRANAQLDAALGQDAEFAAQMEKLIPGVQKSVARAGGRATPEGHIWHHDGAEGVLHLVPQWQHTPGSIFWNALHPGGRGGYSIWAIPAGAPKN